VALDADRASRIAGLMRRVEIERKRDLPHSCALATSLTLRLLADLAAEGQPTSSPAPTQGRPWYQGDSMARVRAYVQDLEQHFFEATNLDAAAASLGLSRRRFTQLFRQCTDSSWLAYVRRLRIEHAKRLLAEPQKTVLSIAFECGFEDLSTFYRAFKREVGVSPNQWRQS
jgi:AraC-like DNA-binding protein